MVGWGQSSRVYRLNVSVGGLRKVRSTSGLLMAPACLMFLLTRRFAEKKKKKTPARIIKASGWNIWVYTNKVGMLATFDVC